MKKRLFSALLALLMLLSSFAPLSSFALSNDNFPYTPYLDEDGYYYRIYNGAKKPFNTDYASMVDYFCTELEANKKSISFDFATSDEKYKYTYNGSADNDSENACNLLYNNLFNDVNSNAENSGKFSIGYHNVSVYLSDGDYPFGDNERYYTFTITLSSITYENAFPYYPYTDSNGIYYRISDGTPIAFHTDYDEMIEYFQQSLMKRRNTFSYYFATTDEKYKYSKGEEADDSTEVSEKFVHDVLSDVYKKDSDKISNAAGGDYLFKSIKNIASHGYGTYLSAGDTPIEGNQRYYTFKISFSNISYYTSTEQEEAVANYCKAFSDNFIPNNATDYEKVKTIYDFVVRNTEYDWEVYGGDYDKSGERYNIAHSAYGALIGGLKDNAQYDFSTKESVTGQKIIQKANQGKAVCEGYSKLFYYLCVSNGIPCRIVDGDYLAEANKGSDAHEWNLVWLDDGCGDGYKWFEVDTTFASQKSFKEVDVNDYNYFLGGISENPYFGIEHQQPFHIDSTPIISANVIYDYWGDNGDSTYVPSNENYKFKLHNLTSIEALNNGYIVKRSTVYPGDSEEKVALIYSNRNDQYIFQIDENGRILETDIKGFIYNGQEQSVFEVIVPYLNTNEYIGEVKTGITEAGRYTLDITGENGTSVQARFEIIKLNLDNGNGDNYGEISIQESAQYTGGEIIPEANIIDGYNNHLKEGRDYVITAYSDANHTEETKIQNIGVYYIDVNYNVSNNYEGHYYLTFTVNKVGMDQLEYESIEYMMQHLEYLPKYFRNQNNIQSPADYFYAGASNLNIGDYNVAAGKDFSVTSQGVLSGNAKGQITLTGLPGSDAIVAGTTKTINYHISEKFDISMFDGEIADSNSVNKRYYSGGEIEPGEFDYLDKYLQQGTDYVISSYSNNINAGEATVVIKGINGCSGTAKMRFLINRMSILNTNYVKIMATQSGNNVTYTIKFNGKDLVKGKDYTEKIETISGGYKIVLTGINNFIDAYTINVKGDFVKPTTSGNYVTLSSSKYTYSGKANKPTVKVYNKNKKLINAYYYTVSYSSNTNPGTAKVTVKFRNGYSGSITKTFTVNPKGTSLSSLTAASKAFTAKWKKYATQTSGYEVQYSTDSKFKKGNKTVKITNNSTTSKKITKLSKKKTYYVRIRTYKTVSGKKYYSSWSGSKKVKTK